MEEKLIILARKRSADPAQEHLREQKAIWNEAAKMLIAKLIAFKRGMNGRGDPRVGLPPSKIQDPLPQEIGSYLSQLADDYLGIIQGAEAIIREQEHYSQVRRKPQPRTENNPLGALPQAAADDGLFSEASWWGSRFWASTFGLGGKDKIYIRKMLRASESAKHHLLDLENILSSSYVNSIPDAVRKATRFGNLSYNNLLDGFRDMLWKNYQMKIGDMPARDQSKPEEAKPPVAAGPTLVETKPKAEPVVETFSRAKFDFIRKDRVNAEVVIGRLSKSDLLSPEDKVVVQELFESLNHDSVPFHRKKILSDEQLADRNAGFLRYEAAYNGLLTLMRARAGVEGNNFAEISKNIREKLTTEPEQKIEIQAHNALTRKIKQFLLRHKPFQGDERDVNVKKLAVIEEGIAPALLHLEELMNQLEKPGSKPQEDIWPKLQVFVADLGRIYEDVSGLAHDHNMKVRDEILSKKSNGILHKIPTEDLAALRKILYQMKTYSTKVLL